jgi:GNAT superfamily N-acetyltransferase
MSVHDDQRLARLGHLNYIEFSRESARWSGRAGRLEERDGLVLFAPSTDFPVICNGVWRLDEEVDAHYVIAAADAWFGILGRGYTLTLRTSPGPDDDLIEAAETAGLHPLFESPEMICRSRLDDRPLPDGAELRWVEDDAGMQDFVHVAGNSFASLGMPAEVARDTITDLDAFTAPHVQNVVAYLAGAPVAAAQTVLSHGIAGVYWVGTLEPARGTGLGEAVTRAVTNRAFDMGATANSLQASSMGEPIYRRMGYEELYRYCTLVRFEPPPASRP